MKTKKQKEIEALKDRINIIENNVKESHRKINMINDILHTLLENTSLCEDTNATVAAIYSFTENDAVTNIKIDYIAESVLEEIKNLRITLDTFDDEIMDIMDMIDEKIEKKLDMYFDKKSNQDEIRYAVICDMIQESNKDISRKLKKLIRKMDKGDKD